MRCLQFRQYAGPQKQEVKNEHGSTIVWQKIKKGMFSNQETKGIFWYEIKKIEKKKKIQFIFQHKLTYDGKKLKKFNF